MHEVERKEDIREKKNRSAEGMRGGSICKKATLCISHEVEENSRGVNSKCGGCALGEH